MLAKKIILLVLNISTNASINYYEFSEVTLRNENSTVECASAEYQDLVKRKPQRIRITVSINKVLPK